MEAVKNTGVNASITKVEDLAEIMRFGVMTTPALVINGKVVVKGKVPTIEELSELLQK